MQAQTPSTRSGRPFVLAFNATGFVLAVAMGLGVLWQGTREQSTPPRTAPAEAVTVASAGRPVANPADGDFTVILVRSPEQAASAEASIAAAADAADRRIPANVHVLLVGSAQEAAHAQWLINEAASFSPTGSIRVVDLQGS